jgi:hypothetical protein
MSIYSTHERRRTPSGAAGLDNTQWLPRHVEDSLEPDNSMWLMKSAFGHGYMIMGGWGTNLFPRDPTWKEPADPPEVQL